MSSSPLSFPLPETPFEVKLIDQFRAEIWPWVLHERESGVDHYIELLEEYGSKEAIIAKYEHWETDSAGKLEMGGRSSDDGVEGDNMPVSGSEFIKAIKLATPVSSTETADCLMNYLPETAMLRSITAAELAVYNNSDDDESELNDFIGQCDRAWPWLSTANVGDIANLEPGKLLHFINTLLAFSEVAIEPTSDYGDWHAWVQAAVRARDNARRHWKRLHDDNDDDEDLRPKLRARKEAIEDNKPLNPLLQQHRAALAARK